MGRGQLNDEAQELAKNYLGREISIEELRLIAYVQFVLVNDQFVDSRKVNDAEIKILAKWEDEGHLLRYMPTIECDKEFWDFMCEILWLTYVCR